MPSALRLTLTDYLGPTLWRWVLSDANGAFLADHDVRLDPAARECNGQVKPDTFSGRLVVILSLEIQGGLVPQF